MEEAVDPIFMDAIADILGNDLGVFIGLTVVLFGAAACLSGQALAQTWRPAWQTVPYTLLLAVGSRFLSFALFDGELLSISGYVIDWIALLLLALVAYRITRAQRMVSQYPWLYERAGVFGWRAKGS
jgi:ABC-type Mn2+/Zn2+ transport system permease subunit